MMSLSVSMFSQPYKVKGTVVDSIGEPLVGATVVLLTAKDSMLIYFTSTDDKGNFIIKSISKGKYIFQANYTSYEKFEKPLDLTGATKTIDKGKVALHKIAYDLKTVEIKGERIPVQFVNDTLIYDALAFDPGKNTTVEDLLKKMPGIEVDEKGDIKAQGKKVEKVTVDGKDFFGDDPKMATQNLPAEAVKKVKVFDKKSEFSEATGIKDGKDKKAIDLELKADHKNGVFGKLTAGYGTENTYLGKASINRFSPKTRVSLIAKTNNTSKEGFDFNDYAKMSGGFSELFQSDGSVMLGGGFIGSNKGLYKVFDGGLNLNYSPNKKIEVNTSYYLNTNNSLLLKDDAKQNFIPGFTYKSQSNTNKISSLFGHNINSLLKYKINKNNKLKLKLHFKNNTNDSESNDTLSNYNENNLSNYQEADNFHNSKGNVYATFLSFNSKLKKQGRAIFIKLSGDYSDNLSQNNTNSLNYYYQDSPNPEIDSIYQEHKNKTSDFKLNGSFAYTEPLWKMTYLVADFNQGLSTNSYNRNLYDRYPSPGKNENSEDIYDSKFNHSDSKLSFKYNGIKTQFSIGMKYQLSTQSGDYISESTKLSRNYRHWLPSADFNHKFSKMTNFRMRFYSNVDAPSILQLMPIVDNSNPQYVVLGNDHLEPEKSNNLSINLNNFNQFNGTSLWLNLHGSIVQNTIVNSRNVDELFRTVSRPINLGQSERISVYGSYSMPFKLLKSFVSFGINGGYNHSYTLLNHIKNDYKKYNYSLDFDIHNYKNKHITGRIGVKYDNTITQYSVDKSSNNTFGKLKYFANIKWKVTKNIKFNNSLKYSIYSNKLNEKTNDEILWDAALLFFIQNKRYTIKLAAIDLLNQGIGYKQMSGDNYIQYSRTNRIGRYFMMSVTYSLSKFKGPKEGDVIIFKD